MTEDNTKLVEGEVRDAALVLSICAAHIRDPDESYALRDQMIALADEAGVTNLVIDFQHVQFMGSIGFLALMSLRRHAPNGNIILCGLSTSIHKAFAASRLIPNDRTSSAVFGTAESVEQALRNFTR